MNEGTPNRPALGPGSRIGQYEIAAAIGAGGMGEVYRARDTKLNRDVAIKVLPAAFAQDHERVARFKREAQVPASLNHPNIAGIYGTESSALVMEQWRSWPGRLRSNMAPRSLAPSMMGC